MTEQTDAAEVEALAEELLACACGHSLDEHNGLGCYARLTYTPTVVKCDCPLTDDRTYAELLAPRLASREAAAAARGAQAVLAAVEGVHVPGHEGAGWCAGCHDGARLDVHPCGTLSAARAAVAQVAPSRVPGEGS